MISRAGLRVGLTGGIASGKSTVARIFGELGCITVDADRIVADLYRSGAAGHDALVRTYGSKIVAGDGSIDRRALADIAFTSSESARQLNALIHPLVIAEEQKRLREIDEGDAIVIVEATLLLEAGGRQRYDRIVVVDVDPEIQIERAVSRGMTREEVVRRIAHQMPREERLRHADYVIDNNGDLEQLERETRRVNEALRKDSLKNELRISNFE